MNVYPIYLNRLDSRKTVLVGGNHEAERKVRELLECDARVTLIAPEVTPSLRELADEGRIEWIARRYRRGDLKGAFLVIVAQFEGDENRRIHREAEKRGILVNVMDDIPHCTFTFGSMVRRGPLILSISTSGAAPTLAVRLRQRFEKEFGEEYGPFLEFMRQLRPPMAKIWTDFNKRKALWYKLVDSDLIGAFRDQDRERALEIASAIVGNDVVRKTDLYRQLKGGTFRRLLHAGGRLLGMVSSRSGGKRSADIDNGLKPDRKES